MLVLSRRAGEKIIINSGEIVIVALGMRNGEMRIGIQAGPEFVVDREEVDEAKRESNRRILD